MSWFVWKNVADDALENARLEAAGGWAQFWRIVVPANWRFVVGTSLVLLVVCWGELSASHLVLPPGVDTMPRRMLGLLHSGVDDRTAGLTIAIVASTMLFTCAGWGMVNWHRRRNSQ
jgi:iron(III) transport system permease protein